MISEVIRKEFASGILISDVNSYIDAHKLEYEEWKEKKRQKLEKKSKCKKVIKTLDKKEADYEVC